MASPVESVTALLSRNGAATGASLQSMLSVSQATLSRAITKLGDRVVRIGGSRNTRYGLRRELPGIGSNWPLFQISARGEPTLVGRLHALARDQYWLDAPIGAHSRFSDGLPFYLQDLVPQGFIGRTVPRRYPELQLPERITDWSDDHVLTYLCRRGEDCIGNLILGDESLQRFLRPIDAPSIISSRTRAKAYGSLAEAALAGSIAGTSAGGEHPKFTAAVQQGSAIRQVLVKFSPGGTDRVARRWADLLICEQLATKVLHEAGLTPAVADLLIAGDQVFLESERFDRTGARGRSGVVSLGALANEYLGRRDNWTTAAAGLAQLGIISRVDAETVRRIATFGRLIGNTDMHFGNLSFQLSFDGPLTLAPVYDMLPMSLAPLVGGALPAREFEPPSPTSADLDIWNEIADLAENYWREVATHDAVSTDFAAQARRNVDRVRAARTSR
jgi:hypothetical protein